MFNLNTFQKISQFVSEYLTISKRKAEILKTREIPTPEDREILSKKPILDSLTCPYCSSLDFVRRGTRTKKLESVQLYLCKNCHKTFTPHSTKGKHYPLSVIFDAISLYNLGYSLEESCRIVNEKNAHSPAPAAPAPWRVKGSLKSSFLKGKVVRRNEYQRVLGKGLGLVNEKSANVLPSLSREGLGVSLKWGKGLKVVGIQPSTLSNWLSQFAQNLPFLRMRNFAMSKFKPEDMVITATLAHRQLYRFRFHRAKCQLIMQEHFHHRLYTPLVEFLEMVPGECPHQYFSTGLRASETPLTFSKTAMIVRGKTNCATKLASFVLQSAKNRKSRHDILQKFMLYNDSVTVATEVPVYLTRDDIEHMQTQLGFQIYQKGSLPNLSEFANMSLPKTSATTAEVDVADIASLPKLITGHIDILQIRNGQIHILDYKPNAAKEQPIEQLTLYAMALSRLTGLRLFEFKCAWFDENDYFEFFPLHVLHKPKSAIRRRKVYTMEGLYQINQDAKKILTIKPTKEGF